MIRYKSLRKITDINTKCKKWQLTRYGFLNRIADDGILKQVLEARSERKRPKGSKR